MNCRCDPIRRSSSAVVAMLMLGSSVAVPAIEWGAPVGETAVESRHDATRCAHKHDHRICTQVGANLSVATSESDHRLGHVLVRVAPPADVRSARASAARSGPQSRAPPLA